MTRRLLAALVVVLCLTGLSAAPIDAPAPSAIEVALPGPAVVDAAPACYWHESQGWWNGSVGGGQPDHVAFPFRHVHGRFCIPTGTVSGIVEVPFEAFTHGNVGSLKHVKWQDDKGGAAQTVIVKPTTPVGPDDVFAGVLRIDTRNEADGIRHWRFYDVWQHSNGNTHTARPRWPVDVENGLTAESAEKNFTGSGSGATSWYKVLGGRDWGYCLVTLTAIPGAGVPVVKMSVNGGPAISAYSIHIGASFHDPGDFMGADGGAVIRQGTGAFNGPLTGLDQSEPIRLALRGVQVADGDQHDCVSVWDLPAAA